VVFSSSGNRPDDLLPEGGDDGLLEVFPAVDEADFPGGNRVFKLFDDRIGATAFELLHGGPRQQGHPEILFHQFFESLKVAAFEFNCGLILAFALFTEFYRLIPEAVAFIEKPDVGPVQIIDSQFFPFNQRMAVGEISYKRFHKQIFRVDETLLGRSCDNGGVELIGSQFFKDFSGEQFFKDELYQRVFFTNDRMKSGTR
jgi:hypothetical protein